MNKGEKRVLKFALAHGEDLSKVGDLKSYLNSKIKDSHAQKGKAMAGQTTDKQRNDFNINKKGNDYRQLEDYTSD